MGKDVKKSYPAKTPEARENQLINLAMNLAEKKLREGSASSQIITTLLNSATTKHQLEIEKLRSDLRVAEAKIKAMESQSDYKDLLDEALSAFKSYKPDSRDEDYDEY